MKLVTKIDEAGTHRGADYMTMAGYGALPGQWSRFDPKWRKALSKSGLRYFHVKEHRDHPFALDAVRIADQTLMFGLVVRLDAVDYQRHYRNTEWPGKQRPDSMYGLCFRYLLAGVLQIATEQLPHKDLVLNFVIESGHSNAGAPAEIVRRVKQKQLPGVSEFLGEVVIGEKRRVPGLQAADGLASGAWHLERKGIPQLGPPTQPSIQGWNPRQTGWRVPIMRCHIDPPTLAELKKDHFALVEYRRAFGQRGSQEL